MHGTIRATTDSGMFTQETIFCGEEAMSERNIKIILQYDGGRYDGWQKQGNTEKTIQGKLEMVLEKMAGQPVEVHGSGRTDAGVHALGQVANFHIPGTCDTMSAEKVKDYLNHYLPDDIAVLSAEEVNARFHSRLNAVSKTYCYRVEMSTKKNVFERRYVYGLGEALDIEKMKLAASYLTGEHDFKGFCSLKRIKKSTVRNLIDIDISVKGSVCAMRFCGDGFLYNMVRILTGTLIEVGLEKRAPQSVNDILLSCDRCKAGFTAPSEGLFLEKVEYE